MNKIIIIVSIALFASCGRGIAHDNRLLETRLEEKARQVSGLMVMLESKKAENERLKADIAARDRSIGKLNELLLYEMGEKLELKDQVRLLNEINLKQRRHLEAQVAQIKAIQQEIRSARRDRDFWSDRFHTQFHNSAVLIQMKDGIIGRQKRDIEEQNEMMARFIRQRDIARASCAGSSPIILSLPKD